MLADHRWSFSSEVGSHWKVWSIETMIDLGLQLLGDEGIQESEEVDSTSRHPTEPGSKTGAAGP